jgi:hypothetical protein
MTEIDAGVESFFSKYDDEELVDQSASSADTPDESSKEEPEVAPKDESKEDESKLSD